MFRRAASLAAINVVVLAVAAELVALGVFYFQTGWLFYIDPYRPALARVAEPPGNGLTAAALHPFFGPTHQPGVLFDIPESLRAPGADPGPPRKTNNFGFVSPFDYPRARTSPRDYVVGIFGGSVGAWFCQIGVDRLVARLQASPALQDRAIVPLCFSHEGYKQPQQLLILSYFLSIGQPLDAVVNVDGFNEVALSRLNDARGSDISMPSVMHMDPLAALVDASALTPARVDALAAIQRERRALSALAGRAERTWFASVYLVAARLHGAQQRRYQADVARFDQSAGPAGAASLLRMTPKVHDRQGETLYEAIAAEWLQSSLLMQQMLAPRAIPYVHVLQPNQYYGTRTYSAEERAVAFNEGSPFKPGAEQGYPRLEAALASGVLQRAGAIVVDGVHLFDGERAAVYMDDCCHYTRRGNEILADAVADALSRARK